jgi:PAS domain S-box-containing protein
VSQRIPLSPEFMRGLKEAEATYRYLVEGIPAILYIDAVDDLSSALYMSPQVEAILGFTREEWLADPGMWLSRLHEDDRERAMVENRRSNETGEPFRCEYRLIAADGREVWFLDEAVLVQNEADEPLFWRGFMFDITDKRHTEEKLRWSLDILRRTMQERRALLTRLEEAQEEERRRIAADIHDDSIQVISAADLQVQSLLGGVEDPKLRRGIDEVHETLKLAAERLRRLLFELRPPALDREGLAAALRVYLSGAEGGPEFSIEDGLEAEPPPEIRTVLFRIAQEAIVNVRKHAGADRLRVALVSEEGGVRMSISDDGRGFDTGGMAAPAPGHLGLPTMIERAELAGGWCRVRSATGEGTVVECWLPTLVYADAGERPIPV